MGLKDWQISEANCSLVWNSVPVPRSGAGLDSKLDHIIPDGPIAGTRIENKQTSKESYSIKKADLRKYARQAAMTGDKFFLRIDFGGGEVYNLFPEDFAASIVSRIDDDEEEA